MKPLALACFYSIAVASFLITGGHAIAQTKDRPPGWIADKTTGCKVWNPAPEHRESIRWTGGCKNGLADGVGTLQWLENGKESDRYIGGYAEGKRNGHGVIVQRDGTRVEGDWRDDVLLQIGVNEIDFRF